MNQDDLGSCTLANQNIKRLLELPFIGVWLLSQDSPQVPTSKDITENDAGFGLILMRQNKQRIPVFVLSEQQAPAESRKLWVQPCCLHPLALFSSFRDKITRRNPTLSGSGRASSCTAWRQHVAAELRLVCSLHLLEVHQRGATYLQHCYLRYPSHPRDRRLTVQYWLLSMRLQKKRGTIQAYESSQLVSKRFSSFA